MDKQPQSALILISGHILGGGAHKQPVVFYLWLPTSKSLFVLLVARFKNTHKHVCFGICWVWEGLKLWRCGSARRGSCAAPDLANPKNKKKLCAFAILEQQNSRNHMFMCVFGFQGVKTFIFIRFSHCVGEGMGRVELWARIPQTLPNPRIRKSNMFMCVLSFPTQKYNKQLMFMCVCNFQGRQTFMFVWFRYPSGFNACAHTSAEQFPPTHT